MESFSEPKAQKGVLNFDLKSKGPSLSWVDIHVLLCFFFLYFKNFKVEKLLYCDVKQEKTKARAVEWRLKIQKTFERWN